MGRAPRREDTLRCGAAARTPEIWELAHATGTNLHRSSTHDLLGVAHFCDSSSGGLIMSVLSIVSQTFVLLLAAHRLGACPHTIRFRRYPGRSADSGCRHPVRRTRPAAAGDRRRRPAIVTRWSDTCALTGYVPEQAGGPRSRSKWWTNAGEHLLRGGHAAPAGRPRWWSLRPTCQSSGPPRTGQPDGTL